MRSIFEPLRSGWDSLTGSVHVYALPGWDRSVVGPWQDAIEQTGVCAVQPAPYLHATIQRIPVFLRTDRPEELEGFSRALTTLAAAHPPFEVPLRRPEVMTTAVCATGEPTAPWDALVASVRSANAAAFPGRPTPAGPHAPHVSLGYARQDADDTPLRAAFASLEDTSWTATLTVDAVHLLSVDANSDAGSFTWTSLSVHPLG